MRPRCDKEWDAYDTASREAQARGELVSEALCSAFEALSACTGMDEGHPFTRVCREFRAENASADVS
jgi:hypothetical protein